MNLETNWIPQLLEEAADDYQTEQDARYVTDLYNDGSKEVRHAIDMTLISICGWSLSTLIKRTNGIYEDES